MEDDAGGSGDGETGVNNDPSNSLNIYKECTDRIVMPCDSEEFITVSSPMSFFTCIEYTNHITYEKVKTNQIMELEN